MNLVPPQPNKLLNLFRGFRNCCSVRSVEYYQAPEMLRLLVNVLPQLQAAATHPDRATSRWVTVTRLEERRLAETIQARASRGQPVEDVLLLMKQYWEIENLLQGLRGHAEHRRLEGQLATVHQFLERYRPETGGGALSTVQALIFLAGERIHSDNDSIPANMKNAVLVLSSWRRCGPGWSSTGSVSTGTCRRRRRGSPPCSTSRLPAVGSMWFGCRGPHGPASSSWIR